LQNRYIDERTARDIDKRITKILNDLDNPEPPLRLEQVRELLKLDFGFYSSSDTGAIAETIHRLKVAGKQVWHDAVMHGDMKRTLSLACEEQVESEANFAAGRLLFLQDAFVEHVRSSPLTFESVKALSKVFGNTITSTLWRAVESCDRAAFGMVSQHPKHELAAEPLRYFVRSKKFCDLFPGVSAMQVFKALQTFCFGNRGPIGNSEVHFVDLRGEKHVFFVEVFFNGYEALTLGSYQELKSRETGLR